LPSDQFLTYEASGVAGVLRTESLAVPGYQRSYSWSSDVGSLDTDGDNSHQQVVEYWEDLHGSFRSDSAYFLGTIVLSQEGVEDGRAAVLDGQQRLATTSILMFAISEFYRTKGETELADSVFADYVGNYDRDAEENRPKLIMNTEDRDYFRSRFLTRDVSASAVGQSQKQIESALAFLTTRVEEFCSNAGARWKEDLKSFIDYLDKRAQVITISVANDSDAFLIFETLNDRGADLTIADLLKNYLFSKAEGRFDEVRDAWVRTLGNLDIPKVGNARFTLFARHFMSARHGVVRERDLYRRIKLDVGDSNSAVAFAKELEASSRLYFGLISSDSDVWSDYSTSARSASEVIVNLNLERYRPLLLAALQKFNAPEVEKLMVAMVSWSVRGLATGRFGGGVAEAAFCNVAKDISAGTITSTAAVLADPRLSSMVPTDKEFQSAFSEWKVTKGSLARYILRTLELEERGEPEPELVVNTETDHVNLEHVLPKSPKAADWPTFSRDEQTAFVHRIGNLVLLQKGSNDKIGNKSWSVKKPVLAKSQLELTKKAAAHADWTKEVIAKRQEDLSVLAVRAWKR